MVAINGNGPAAHTDPSLHFLQEIQYTQQSRNNERTPRPADYNILAKMRPRSGLCHQIATNLDSVAQGVSHQDKFTSPCHFSTTQCRRMRIIAQSNIKEESRHGLQDLRRMLGHISLMEELVKAQYQAPAARPPPYEKITCKHGTTACVDFASDVSKNETISSPPALGHDNDSSDSEDDDEWDDDETDETLSLVRFQSHPPVYTSVPVKADGQPASTTSLDTEYWEELLSEAARKVGDETSSASVVEVEVKETED